MTTMILRIMVGLFLLIAAGTSWAVIIPGAQQICGTATVIQSTPVEIVSTTADQITAYQGGIWNINATITGNPILGTSNSNIGNVGVLTLPSIPSGSNVIGSVTILGNSNVPFKQDSTGQIYAITAPESGTNLRKSYTFSNIASTGAWVEIGSYTVTAGKSLKIYDCKMTGLYAMESRISDGTTGDEIYLAVAPASPSDNSQETRPCIKAAGVVITVSAKTTDTVNAGTISWNGFEY